MGGGAAVSLRTCKCCGGTGWDSSDCDEIQKEAQRMQRELLNIIADLRMENSAQAALIEQLKKEMSK